MTTTFKLTEIMSSSSNLNMREKISYFIYDFWEEFGDPRTSKLPLIHGGPWKTISLVVLYILFVRKIGPSLMKNRKPYDLKRWMIIHNGYLAIGNGIGFIIGLLITNFGSEAFSCQKIKTTVDSTSDYIKIYGGWLYFFSKFIDFLDTIFFVLRKKDNQVSGLHVFHHSFMPIATYIGLKFIPGGNIILIPLINTGIHAIMYTYYGIAAAGPEYRKYLWWKKYLTLIQVMQFVIFAIHSIYGLIIPDCSYHKFFSFLELVYAFIFFDLFFTFYKKSYLDKKPPSDKPSKTINNNNNNILKNGKIH